MDPAVVQGTSLLLQVAMGVSLAACAGLRAFLPLLVVGAAGRMEWIPLSGRFEWLAGTPALIVLGVAVLTELLGDKFPVVDHFLDVVQGLVKPVAGTVLMASVVTELEPLHAAVLGLLVGGSVAGGVHVAKAQVRLVSSAATAGLGNPALSVAEDAGAFAGSVAALLWPLAVAVLLLLALVAVAVLLRRQMRRRSVRAASGGHSVA